MFKPNLFTTSIVSTIAIATLFSSVGYSAVTLDRTRVIFPGDEKSINVTINNNAKEAYLAQSWIEDLQGNKLTKGAILATPPLQRVEPTSSTLVRLSSTPEVTKLPQDRESVFFFNVREVPPKPKDGNTLQIALQSRVKLFYRPTAILSEAQTKWTHKITLTKIANGYRLNNPTPFNFTAIGFGDTKTSAESDAFEAIMVSPKSSYDIKSVNYSTPYISYINDFGGKPTLVFRCQGDTCSVTGEQ